jgi:hypothetical protein
MKILQDEFHEVLLFLKTNFKFRHKEHEIMQNIKFFFYGD